MPRPKGSKNKAPRKVTVANNDFEALIAEKSSAKEYSGSVVKTKI